MKDNLSKKILIYFIVWFLFLNLINKLSYSFLADSTSYELPKNIKLSHRFWILPWLNFDGRNYLEIVSKGYSSVGQKIDLRVFFPLYPLLIKIFSLNLLFNPVLVGILISLFFFAASLYLFDRLLSQDKFMPNDRQKTILLLISFPTSFYFAAFYTESLFLFLTLLTFYFLNKNKFFFASIFTALATATRATGFALIPSLLWQGYKHYRKTKKLPFSVFLSPLGYITYSFYLQFATGSSFSAVSAQKYWGRSIGINNIWIALRDGFVRAVFRSKASIANNLIYSVEVLEFVAAVLLIFIIVFGFKKTKFTYWLYLFFSGLIIFSTGVLGSLPRFLVVMCRL